MGWTDAVITNAGVAMLRQSQAPPEFTSAAGGEGTVPAALLMAQDGLADRRQDFGIVGVADVEQGKRLHLRVANIGLGAGYMLNQVGIWAVAGSAASTGSAASPGGGEQGGEAPAGDADAEPVLFAILQDAVGIPIPQQADFPEFVFEFYVIVPISNEAKWTARIDPSVLATLGDLDSLEAGIEKVASDAKVHYSRTDNPHAVTAKGIGAATLEYADAGRRNPNILHNWDFRSPVNQRGESQYSLYGYTIDRWFCGSASAKVSMQDGYVSFARAKDGEVLSFFQKIECAKSLGGSKATLTVRYRSTAAFQAILTWNPPYGASGFLALPQSDGFGARALTVDIPPDITTLNFYIQMPVAVPVGGRIDIESAKLESGGVSTLANDPPADYGAELANCQRHFCKMNGLTRWRAIFTAADSITAFIPLPVSMRIAPAIHSANTLISEMSQPTNQYAATSLAVDSLLSNGVLIKATRTGHGFSDGAILVNTLELSADM